MYKQVTTSLAMDFIFEGQLIKGKKTTMVFTLKAKINKI